MTRALIIVDVQNDFCEGGSLAVEGGAAVAANITEFVNKHGSEAYDFIVATMDWHRDPGDHFSDDPDYHDTWPHHCVAGTSGAEFHPNLEVEVDAVFKKGLTEAAYSGFQGTSDDIGEPLAVWLLAQRVDQIDVVGIAYGHCVKATAIDGAKEGFDTVVLKDLTASVNPDNDRADTTDMLDANVTVLA